MMMHFPSSHLHDACRIAARAMNVSGICYARTAGSLFRIRPRVNCHRVCMFPSHQRPFCLREYSKVNFSEKGTLV